jgi:hypothetical protein
VLANVSVLDNAQESNNGISPAPLDCLETSLSFDGIIQTETSSSPAVCDLPFDLDCFLENPTVLQCDSMDFQISNCLESKIRHPKTSSDEKPGLLQQTSSSVEGLLCLWNSCNQTFQDLGQFRYDKSMCKKEYPDTKLEL